METKESMRKNILPKLSLFPVAVQNENEHLLISIVHDIAYMQPGVFFEEMFLKSQLTKEKLIFDAFKITPPVSDTTLLNIEHPI